MKKYITIAALLAAGSACANATENLSIDAAAGWFYRTAEDWETQNIQFSTDSGNTVFSVLDNEQEINFQVGTRSTYTFAVTLDLEKLTLPETNTSVMWGGEKVGFGLKDDGTVTASIGSGTPAWKSTTFILPESGELTIVLSTGDSGTRYSFFNAEGNAGKAYWDNLKESSAINNFTIESTFLAAVEKSRCLENE